MTDFMSAESRSRAMSRVSAKQTNIELLVCSYLHAKGLKFKKNVSTMPGRPDIVLPKYKAAIFVHGCFWHGHSECKRSKLPESNAEFWQNKVDATIVRDERKIHELFESQWRVAVVWQCLLRNRITITKTLDQLYIWILQGGNWLEISHAIE